MRMFEYCARAVRAWPAAVLITMLSTQLGAQTSRLPSADATCAPTEPQNVVLTVQGGGSLGVYEGGMTWAFLEIFKRRTALQEGEGALLGSEHPGETLLRCLPWFRLAATTGSSAGSINAFLAASDWCDRRLTTRPDSSSFWLAWVNTGVEQLLPRSDTGRREKGVFAREHFRRNIFPALVNDYWKDAKWKPSCNVAFGAAITRLRADSFPIGAIYARTQRYAATFDVSGDAMDGQPPHLRARKEDVGKPDMGSVIALQGGDSVIAIESAFDVLEASSGYPLIFATKPLSVCKMSHSCQPCANSATAVQDCADQTEFLDGGVFDNSPLALAFALGKNPNGPPIAVYLAPENRRHQGFGPVATTLTPRTRQRAGKGDPLVSDGLNELIVLAPELVSTARAYELQITSRMLPGSQRELMLERAKKALAEQLAELSNRKAEETRRADSLERDNASLESDARTARTAIALFSMRIDSLKRELEYARGVASVDSAIPAALVAAPGSDSIVRSQRFRELMSSVRLASASGDVDQRGVKAFAVGPVLTGEATPQSMRPVSASANGAASDTSMLPIIRETGRFHPIAGEWLAGFGAFLGRPLREYDFYVGVYDAFIVVARNTRCPAAAPADLQECVRTSMRDLLRARVVSIGPVAERLMNGLYASEFGGEVWSEGELSPLTHTDSTHSLILDGIRRAMLAPGHEQCEDRNLLSAQMCRDRMTAAFEALRANSSVMSLLRREADAAACDPKAELSVSMHCAVERRFLEMVEDPEGSFDVLGRQVLARLVETTPRGGVGAKATDVMSLFYYSTNDRDRRGTDMGSISLPSYLPWSWRPVWLLPSSITYTRKAGSVDLGWEVRQHLRTLPFAIAAPLRLDFSHVGEYGGQGNPTRVIAGGRLDLKNCFPGCFPDWLPLRDMLPSALVSRIGYEWDFWWRYTSTHPWTPSGEWPYTGLSHGVDVLLLGGKIEISVMTVPHWLRGQGLVSSKIAGTPVFVRLGAADVNGMLYWLSRMMLM